MAKKIFIFTVSAYILGSYFAYFTPHYIIAGALINISIMSLIIREKWVKEGEV
jgi:hypothetical protein